MSGCCENTGCELEKLERRQRGTLRVVLWVNVVMFAAEFTAGLAAASTALLGDALDMLGDASVYAFSLYAVGRGTLWKARAATAKGWIMVGFAALVVAQAGAKLVAPELPHHPTMGALGLLALAANGFCLALLWRHRGDDVNMRSVWLCSRNDIVANVAVLAAAAAVWQLQSQVPDLLVGAGIALLFLHSGVDVLRDAGRQRRAVAAPG